MGRRAPGDSILGDSLQCWAKSTQSTEAQLRDVEKKLPRPRTWSRKVGHSCDDCFSLWDPVRERVGQDREHRAAVLDGCMPAISRGTLAMGRAPARTRPPLHPATILYAHRLRGQGPAACRGARPAGREGRRRRRCARRGLALPGSGAGRRARRADLRDGWPRGGAAGTRGRTREAGTTRRPPRRRRPRVEPARRAGGYDNARKEFERARELAERGLVPRGGTSRPFRTCRPRNRS